MGFHEDPLFREEVITGYLLKRLQPYAVEAFESHFLDCEECLEEIHVTELIIAGLQPVQVSRRTLEDVTLLEFSGPVRLVRRSRELHELSRTVLEQKDTKVLIDLSRVSRIDSAGLGLLMSCYSHAIRNQGALKLLNPNQEVTDLLRLTRIDSVLETFHDERDAVRSFQSP